MMAAASMQGQLRRAGENAAAHLLEELPELASVPDSVTRAYDAVALDPLEEHDFVDVRASLERGDRVEFKSAMVRLASGERGRLNFRKKQHERLLEVGGKYGIMVCEPTPERRVLAAAIVDPVELEKSESGWVSLHVPDRAEEAFRQIAWSIFVDPADVPREEGGQ